MNTISSCLVVWIQSLIYGRRHLKQHIIHREQLRRQTSKRCGKTNGLTAQMSCGGYVLWRRNRRLKDGDCERQACMRPTDDRILSIPRLARLGTRRASGSDSMKDLELVDRARAWFEVTYGILSDRDVGGNGEGYAARISTMSDDGHCRRLSYLMYSTAAQQVRRRGLSGLDGLFEDIILGT